MDNKEYWKKYLIKVKAKQQYVCDITNKPINIGELYWRYNRKNYGIFYISQLFSFIQAKEFITDTITKDYEEEHWWEFDTEIQ